MITKNNFLWPIGALLLMGCASNNAISDDTPSPIVQEIPKPDTPTPPDEPTTPDSPSTDAADPEKADEDKDKKKEKPKFKDYEDVITKDAVSQSGIFKTHLVNGKAFFEIPVEHLGREFVWQVKVAGIQTGKGTISADSARRYVYFERIGDDILVRARNYSVISNENEPESFVVEASDLDAILIKAKILTFGENETPVIDVTSAFTGAVKGLEGLREGKIDSKVSLIKNIKAFERNIEARVLGRFTRKVNKTTEEVTAEVRHSLFALPDDLMKPRYYNHRVGFFDNRFQNYSGKKNKVEEKRLITRWRLTKKDPNAALSEPVKPIIWYIDPGTPKRYVEATREGIEYWQSAFEQAGFKNAIIAKDAPTPEEDPDWDPEDARYAVVRWVPSNIANAQGPHVSDPRTGEIIEADVRMYHNIIKLVEEWYYSQAGATDPRAKKLPLPDDVMHDLVRFVVAHEVGHSIGLHHNFIGSNAYTIEQLRDPAFVAKNGVASSIMEYARFNYVIQPEDGVSPIDYVPGPYDKFAIEWGYKEFPGNLTPEEEIPLLNKIADRQLENPELRWDAYSAGSRPDPRIQTEDIGNDAMEATRLGMLNLERIMSNIVDAASYEDGQTYNEIRVAYRALASQFSRELGHVTKYIGSAIYRNELAQGHSETAVYDSFPIEKQQEAMVFLQNNAFKIPSFWRNEDVLKRVGYDFFMETVSRFGTSQINRLISPGKTDQLIEWQAAGLESYDPVALFADLRDGIFKETETPGTEVNGYRRHLQSHLVNRLIAHVTAPAIGKPQGISEEHRALSRASLIDLMAKMEPVANSKDLTGIHYQNLSARIKDALENDT